MVTVDISSELSLHLKQELSVPILGVHESMNLRIASLVLLMFIALPRSIGDVVRKEALLEIFDASDIDAKCVVVVMSNCNGTCLSYGIEESHIDPFHRLVEGFLGCRLKAGP